MGAEDDTARDALGRLVREVWVAWAREQASPKPTWLVGWDDLPEPDREVDRRIGETLYAHGRADAVLAARYLPPDQAAALRTERDQWKAAWSEVAARKTEAEAALTEAEAEADALRAEVAQAWPCDNYTRPTTCLTTPSSESGRCNFCGDQAAQANARAKQQARDVERLAASARAEAQRRRNDNGPNLGTDVLHWFADLATAALAPGAADAHDGEA